MTIHEVLLQKLEDGKFRLNLVGELFENTTGSIDLCIDAGGAIHCRIGARYEFAFSTNSPPPVPSAPPADADKSTASV